VKNHGSVDGCKIGKTIPQLQYYCEGVIALLAAIGGFALSCSNNRMREWRSIETSIREQVRTKTFTRLLSKKLAVDGIVEASKTNDLNKEDGRQMEIMRMASDDDFSQTENHTQPASSHDTQTKSKTTPSNTIKHNATQSRSASPKPTKQNNSENEPHLSTIHMVNMHSLSSVETLEENSNIRNTTEISDNINTKQ